MTEHIESGTWKVRQSTGCDTQMGGEEPLFLSHRSSNELIINDFAWSERREEEEEGNKGLRFWKERKWFKYTLLQQCYTSLLSVRLDPEAENHSFLFFLFLVKDIEGKVWTGTFLSLVCTRDPFFPLSSSYLVHCTLIKRTTRSSEVVLSCPSFALVLLLYYSSLVSRESYACVISLCTGLCAGVWFMWPSIVKILCQHELTACLQILSPHIESGLTDTRSSSSSFSLFFPVFISKCLQMMMSMCLSGESQIWEARDGKRTKLIRKSLIWLLGKSFPGLKYMSQTHLHDVHT